MDIEISSLKISGKGETIKTGVYPKIVLPNYGQKNH
jgi:hypothetical protein